MAANCAAKGVLGLTYRFLANGSHTVVASLWPVEDALTARFMEEFYAAYRVSGRTADALRTAQLRTRGTRRPRSGPVSSCGPTACPERARGNRQLTTNATGAGPTPRSFSTRCVAICM